MDALPAELRPELIMDAAAIDGHSVTTHRFRSTSPPDAVAATLRERWRALGLPFVESRSGDWLMLSVRDRDGRTTVQLRASAQGTDAMSSRWERAARNESHHADDAAATALAGWLPADARVLRRVAHRDPGRAAATVVAVVDADPAAASARLRRHAVAGGYVDDPALGHPAGRAAWYRGSPGAGGEALAFRRGREEVVATLSAHAHGTAVVLHWGAPR